MNLPLSEDGSSMSTTGVHSAITGVDEDGIQHKCHFDTYISWSSHVNFF